MIGKIYSVVMSKLLVTMIVLLALGGCSTNWNFENTGLAKEHFDGKRLRPFSGRSAFFML